MYAKVTKITNGYLVTTVNDDEVIVGSKAVLKTAVGNVPSRLVGLAIAGVLGRITVTKKVKQSRKARAPKVAAAEAVA